MRPRRLRRQADDDVAAVREWSKAEIARIREETDERIAARKRSLDGEMEEFAAMIEARVERVSATVDEFEAEMADFFERLLAEEDPTRIATMAEAMPDPPDLAGIAASVTAPPRARAGRSAHRRDRRPTPEAEAEVAPAPEMIGMSEVQAAETAPDAVAEDAAEPAAAVDDAAPARRPTSRPPRPRPPPSPAISTTTTASPRWARRARRRPVRGRRPDAGQRDPASGERVSTRVVVLGLVSVASIATFKRSLGRVTGVSAIGVASGPDGEFVFTVSHDAGLGLADAIAALPGFEATITAETPGGLEVAAHDPDAGD